MIIAAKRRDFAEMFKKGVSRFTVYIWIALQKNSSDWQFDGFFVNIGASLRVCSCEFATIYNSILENFKVKNFFPNSVSNRLEKFVVWKILMDELINERSENTL